MLPHLFIAVPNQRVVGSLRRPGVCSSLPSRIVSGITLRVAHLESLAAKLGKALRESRADIMATVIPPRLARLLDEPPDDRPPRDAPGQRIPRRYDEPAEEAEAAERQVA
jgi:hypothetical protein